MCCSGNYFCPSSVLVADILKTNSFCDADDDDDDVNNDDDDDEFVADDEKD